MQRILEQPPTGVTISAVPARYSKAELRLAGGKLIKDGKPVTLRVPSTSEAIRITGRVQPTTAAP
ncbi:hypothetical protein ACSNOH_13125 [Streptomyces sp. URMC 127]|uniref:hypothetical protein n=1 Tax=Streptomyces sp. URMC 127 TaxID=3423402 RepID=UPI003F1D219E